MILPHEIHVSIGEVKIGKGDDILKASLGSCVGIGLLWKQRKIYGLAHCLLPEAEKMSLDITARFVSQALPSLVALMRIYPEHSSEIDAILVGGGNMTAPEKVDTKDLVGTLNAAAAEKYLKKYGFKVIHKDVGGNAGRKILIFCQTGEFEVQNIPRIIADAG